MRATTVSLLALALGACSPSATKPLPADPVHRPEPPAYVVPVGTNAEGALPTELSSVDLEERERRLLGLTLGQMYTPCSDQAVSLAQCIQESRPCVACKPAALLLADKIKEGATADQLRDIYDIRFGQVRKPVAPGNSPSRGPSDAKVTIIVWSDFECPHCRHAMPLLDRVLHAHENKVRIVHKFYPLRQHLHSEDAARAAIAAQNQGKFWEMLDMLFSHHSALNEADIRGYAKELKLDLARFSVDLNADQTNATLSRDRQEADDLGLTATPFVLINGRHFELGYFHLEHDLEPWVNLEIQLSEASRRP